MGPLQLLTAQLFSKFGALKSKLYAKNDFTGWAFWFPIILPFWLKHLKFTSNVHSRVHQSGLVSFQMSKQWALNWNMCQNYFTGWKSWFRIILPILTQTFHTDIKSAFTSLSWNAWAYDLSNSSQTYVPKLVYRLKILISHNSSDFDPNISYWSQMHIRGSLVECLSLWPF